ncbi:MAG: NADH-quinone oxidoreductase subunit A [Candidatus Bathyarchaeia archaeon]|nr:NADH-quinone oxidoreductase subunit A [Candidatus Bathyarchaeota archaeon]
MAAESSPIIVFILAVIVAAVIYGVGGRISPKPKPSEDKLMPYACGEDMPPERARLGVYLYNYAAMFLILDVVAVIFALSMGVPFKGNTLTSTLATVYIAVAAMAAILIFRRGELRKI